LTPDKAQQIEIALVVPDVAQLKQKLKEKAGRLGLMWR